MATSESEEDYQSADEDVDFENYILPADTKPNVSLERQALQSSVESSTCLTVKEKHPYNNENADKVDGNSFSNKASETISPGEKGDKLQSSTIVSNDPPLKELINLNIDENIKSKIEETVKVKDESKEIEENSAWDQSLIQEEVEIDAEAQVTKDIPAANSELEETSVEEVGANRKVKQARRQKPREQKSKTSGLKKLGVKIESSLESLPVQPNPNEQTTAEARSADKTVQEKEMRGFAEAPRRVDCWEEGVNLPKKEETRGFAKAPRRVDCWEEGVNLPKKKETTAFAEAPRRVDCWEEGVNPPKKEEMRGFDEAPRRSQCWEEDVDSPGFQEKTSPLYVNCDEEPESKKHVNDLKKIDSVLDKISNHSNSGKGSWGGWSGWGVSSLLSTATESVSTLTSQVSQGLSTVLETGLGVPNPEDLARMDLEKTSHKNDKVEEETTLKDQKPETFVQKEGEEHGLFGLGLVMTGVSSIGKLVETAGTKVLTGGLDTLEAMGKKTMEVLQEGDPGLKKKRAFFTGEKIALSQVLQEAKERAEFENREKEDREALRQAHFETLFDDFQGLVHLEALEMLSKKCEMKLEGELFLTSGDELIELQNKVDELKDKCMLPEEDDDDDDDIEEFGWQDELLSSAKQLEVQDSLDKLIKSWKDVETWLDSDHSELSCRQIHIKTMSTLAQLTAEAVKHFHKSAELIAVKTHRNSKQEAEIFRCEALHISRQLRCLATRFSELLDSFAENDAGSMTVNELITSIFLEASNSSSYIRQAFHLVIPVIQVGVIT